MSTLHALVTLYAAIALLAALPVVARLMRTAHGRRVQHCNEPSRLRVSVVVPVLNENARLAPCLDGLVDQPEDVVEILVVDGGSMDGTQALARAYAARDRRVRLVDARPVPRECTGKAWGLECGLRASSDRCDYVLCIDADVRPAPQLTRSLLAHAKSVGVAAFSVAVRQRLQSAGDGLLHPSMLATLVYRFGIPGAASAVPSAVQANGQCFLARRDALLHAAPFRAARASLCEDVTIARCLARAGYAVGFYECDRLVSATMYNGWRDTWRNWPRSLPMRDQYFGWRGVAGLIQIVLVQALPLPLLATAGFGGAPRWAIAVLAALVALRIGVLAGMARAYVARPWTYWLSPLFDLPVAYAVLSSALRRTHSWRGRSYVRVAPGRFQCSEEGFS